MHKIGFYNFKGGVGKTTLLINVSYNLAKLGYSVLIVDSDAQRNTMSFFIKEEDEGKNGILRCDQIEADLIDIDDYYSLIRENNLPKYDFIVIDYPPAYVEENISECDLVFIPVTQVRFSLDAVASLVANINSGKIKFGKLIMNSYKKNLVKYDSAFPQEYMMNTYIPYSESVDEAINEGLACEQLFINKKTPKNPISWQIVYAYKDLTAEILEIIKKGKVI